MTRPERAHHRAPLLNAPIGASTPSLMAGETASSYHVVPTVASSANATPLNSP